jgi:GT2 family glycosyltransferase
MTTAAGEFDSRRRVRRMSASPFISVIVVNWNRKALLEACLRSLDAQRFRDFEIIVVDNGSTDGSMDLLRGRSGVRPISNQVNRGFCAANNQGIAAADGEWIALLNNDAEADPEWLAALADAARREHGFAMFAPKIVSYDDPGVIDKVGHLIYPDGQNRGRGSGERDAGQYDRVEEVAWPDGCAALYRKSMLDQIGGFDEDFFAYADDAELGLRARMAGYRALAVPSALVRHRLGSTLGRYSQERIFLIERNRLWLVFKLFPLRMWPLVPVFYAMRTLASAGSAARGQGDSAQAGRILGAWGLLKCLIRAHGAALAGLPRMLRKRRNLRSIRTLSGAEIAAFLERNRIPLGDLVTRSSPSPAVSP